MPLIAAYHRPDSLEQALSLLADHRRAPLGGGTIINADRDPSELEVVDLQALGLSGIDVVGDRVRIGATATLLAVAGSKHVPDVVRELAQRDQPASIRSIATVGGTIAAAEPDSALVAALLVHHAEVELAGSDDMPLAALLSSGVPGGAIITGVVIDPSGVAASRATGRTPADIPIVAAVARAVDGNITLALTGVAATPVLVPADDPTSGLVPPSDFRGSSSYRTHLASILSTRALEAVR
jgi:CO/xanthine dehydrogenase FAD-binding subunit